MFLIRYATKIYKSVYPAIIFAIIFAIFFAVAYLLQSCLKIKQGMAKNTYKPRALPSIARTAGVDYHKLWKWVQGYHLKAPFSRQELVNIAHAFRLAKNPLERAELKALEEIEELTKARKS